MPIAHGEGNFYLPDDELDRLEGEGQVVFRYTDRRRPPRRRRPTPTAARAPSPASATAPRNVVGLMPHPERASEPELGSADGRRVFESLIHALQAV